MDAVKTGTLINQTRKEKGLTQGDLAQKLHVSTQAVSKWERGLNFPDITLLEPLAQELELTVTELLSGQQAASEGETALRNSLHIVLTQAAQKIRRWRGAFFALCALFLVLLFSAGSFYIRNHTELLPQSTTVVSYAERSETAILAAKVSSGMNIYFYDLTLADGTDQLSLQLELWDHTGMQKTWHLGKLSDMAAFSPPRFQTLAMALGVNPSETDSTLEYALSFWGYTWRGTLDDIPYMESGVGWNVLKQRTTVSPENGVVLACFSVDPSGQGRWRTPGCLGAEASPSLGPGQAFLLLRLQCS